MVTAPALRDFRNGQHPGDLLARLYDWRADYRPTGRGFSCTVRVSCLVLARGAHVRAAFAHGDAVCCIVVLFCQIADDPTSGVGKSRGPDAAIQPPVRNVELDRHRHGDQSLYADSTGYHTANNRDLGGVERNRRSWLCAVGMATVEKGSSHQPSRGFF